MPFTDDFLRSNNDDIAAGAPVPWDERDLSGNAATGMEIVSNRLVEVDAALQSAIAGDSGSADHYAQCEGYSLAAAAADLIGPAVRMNSTGSEGYCALAYLNVVRLYKITGGGITTITDTGTIADPTGKVIRLEATGTTLEVFIDGVSQFTSTQTDYQTNQYVGITGRDAEADNFEATSPDTKKINVWNGSGWDLAAVKVYNGTTWDDAVPKEWNGSAWV